MTKLYFLILLFLSELLLFNACTTSDNESTKELASFIKVSPSNLIFEYTGGSEVLTVECTDKWDVSGETEWCLISTLQTGNNNQVTITVKESESEKDRKALLKFTSSDKVATVEVIQYGKIKTDYIDLNFDDINTFTTFDSTTGVVTINNITTPPNLRSGKTIVLPEKYNYDIRIINNVKISGKNVTLETTQGNMCNLFRNIDFTLTSDPSIAKNTRSGSNRVYTPFKIIGHTDNGSIILYEKDIQTRESSITVNQPIFSFHQNFDGDEIISCNAGKLYWEKCNYGTDLNGLFFFSFGEEIKNGKAIGVPKIFSAELIGKLNADFLLKYEWQKTYNENTDIIVKNRIIYKTFLFNVSGVPVPVTVETHLGKRTEFKSESKVALKAGYQLNGEIRLGMKYENGTTTPIHTFIPSFLIHEPIFNAQGSLMSKVSYYPIINIKLFHFIGPVIEPMPFLQGKLEAGLQLTGTGDNFFGWSSTLSGGLDARLGLSMDFFITNSLTWKSSILKLENTYKDLIKAPKKIELISPQNDIEIRKGQEIEVVFQTSFLNYLNNKYYPCPVTLVNFNAEGNLNTYAGIADSNGRVSLKWKPEASYKNSTLTARIIDKDGKYIDEAVLNVNIKEEDQAVDLGLSVKWAAWNVGASTPEGQGGLYGWADPTGTHRISL